MKLDELVKLSVLLEDDIKRVKLSDLYIFQDNSDIDMNHVNNLISDYKQGYKLDDVLICKITDKFKRDLKALKEKLSGMSTHAKYAKTIDDEFIHHNKEMDSIRRKSSLHCCIKA